MADGFSTSVVAGLWLYGGCQPDFEVLRTDSTLDVADEDIAHFEQIAKDYHL